MPVDPSVPGVSQSAVTPMSQSIEHNDTLEHLLSTARAYQAFYAGRPPHPDPWVRAMRENNDAEVADLEARLAADPAGGATTETTGE